MTTAGQIQLAIVIQASRPHTGHLRPLNRLWPRCGAACQRLRRWPGWLPSSPLRYHFLTSPTLRAAEVRKHYTERQPARKGNRDKKLKIKIKVKIGGRSGQGAVKLPRP
jgi:hypothetical protein